MATGNKPARTKPSSSSSVLGTVRAVAGSVADGARFVRTYEPAFIAGAAPVSLYTAATVAGPPFELAHLTPGFIDPVSSAIDAWVAGGGAGDPASPWALTVATVAAGSAYRYYRKSEHSIRNREMRRIGHVLCTYPHISKVSDRVPRMKNFVRTPAGRRVDIEVPKRCDAFVFEELRPYLQNDLRAEVRIERIPAPTFGPLNALRSRLSSTTVKVSRKSASGGVAAAAVAQGGVRMSIIERDTLAAPLTTPWPVLVPGQDGLIPERVWTDPIPVSLDESAEQVDLSFKKRPSILVAGESGSGKSVFTHEVIDAWILDPRAQLALWDGKGMLELNRYTCLTGGRIAGPDIDQAKAQLTKLKAELTRREESLYARGLEEAPDDDPDCPPLLAVIEEFTAYKDPQFYLDLIYVLVRVRVVNMRILLTVQRPAAVTVPTNIRDNIGMRVCHSQLTSDSSDMALGDGWAKRGWNAQSIPMDDKGTYAGINLLLNDGGNPRRTRSWFVTPAMRTVAVRRALELRGLPTEWADLRGAALAKAVGAPTLSPAASPAMELTAPPSELRAVASDRPKPRAARAQPSPTEFVPRARIRSRPPRAERAANPVPTSKES